jgi:hypothetical protein
MDWLLIWCVVLALLALIPAAIGERKGGSFGHWYLYGFLLLPLAIISAVALKPLGMRKCPKCAEEVKAEALVCRYCQAELERVAPTKPPPPGSRFRSREEYERWKASQTQKNV